VKDKNHANFGVVFVFRGKWYNNGVGDIFYPDDGLFYNIANGV